MSKYLENLCFVCEAPGTDLPCKVCFRNVCTDHSDSHNFSVAGTLTYPVCVECEPRISAIIERLNAIRKEFDVCARDSRRQAELVC